MVSGITGELNLSSAGASTFKCSFVCSPIRILEASDLTVAFTSWAKEMDNETMDNG